MTQSAPKRYAHALIRHFIIISLFLPAFYSQYKNAYYQDVFVANIVALLFIINIFSSWTLDLKRNRYCIIGLACGLVLYNAFSFYNYHHYSELYFYKAYQYNVTIAFIFFITLLTAKEHLKIVSDKVIKLAIYAIVINNVIGIYFRFRGYSWIRMMNLSHRKFPLNPGYDHYSWLYYDYSEYALILLVCMSFFIVYKKHFKNIWTYVLSQAVLLFALYLTKASTFYLAAAALLGFELLYYLINKFHISRKYVLYSIPVVLILGCVAVVVLFTQVDSFTTKFYIWKGNWDVILENPAGLRATFGGLLYDIPNVGLQQNQAHNVFLNHMLRYSLPVGLMYTLMFVLIIVCSFIKHPNYRTAGIWVAMLIPMSMEYALQTINLPFVLFMIYCLFFRNDESKEVEYETEQDYS